LRCPSGRAGRQARADASGTGVEIDGNIHHHLDDLRELQCEARSLLTGEPVEALPKPLKENA
jgi:hypothetical protein